MYPSAVRKVAASAVNARTPLIKFLGPRSALNEAHHEATRHPAAPKDAEYPLKTETSSSSSSTSSSQSVTKTPGPHGATRQSFDFLSLPARYNHPILTEAEIEAIETGGASKIY
ncbi:hypothetical protein BGZ46_007344 [Entomortierella lignicola]|nr:hypothetical protein BGZ46_007344 [Entomortierella lignicola]